MKKQNKPRHDNPYQPPCFDNLPWLQPQPRDRRALPLVGVHALIVRQDNMDQLSQSELIWNRACSGVTTELLQGDRALAGLLVAHGLAMNGGVLHAVECLAENEFREAASGYKYFGLDSVASILTRAKTILDSGVDTEDYEAELDESYNDVVPDDDFLVATFTNHLRANPSEFTPTDNP